MALVVAGGGAGIAVASGNPARPAVRASRLEGGGALPTVHQASQGGQVHAAQASSNDGPTEFTTTADPTSLDPPIQAPPTRPVRVTLAYHAAFGNAPPAAVTTVALPKGHWAQVDLVVSGSESGVQYDRLCQIFDGQSPIFLGVTPEPTPHGIRWTTEKDVTGYLPILTGTQTFSTYVDNYTNSTDTGIPVITATLLFYPAGHGYSATSKAEPWSPGLAGTAINQAGPASSVRRPQVPTDVVPLAASGSSPGFTTINAGGTDQISFTIPADTDTATLDLYAVGQIGEEFWYSLTPGFRELDISVDGHAAGVVWPFPFVYTGGINPLIWRPLTGIHTLDIPSYRLDLTPLLGTMLHAGSTITISVANNTGYWLAGGSLLLGTGTRPASGSLLTDTLTLPTTSHVTTVDALGSTDQPVTSEAASTAYELSGNVREGGRTWTDTVTEHLQFGDDQTNIDPACTGASCYEWLHAEETQEEAETVIGPHTAVRRTDDSEWTIDAPEGYLQSDSGADFVLPASVSQELTDVAEQSGRGTQPVTSRLVESIVGYGDLGVDGSTTTITNGETTGTVTLIDSYGPTYQRSIVTRGGQVVQNLTAGS